MRQHSIERNIGKTTFYFGTLPLGDVRLGISVGNREASVDVFVVTFGFIRWY